MFKLPKKLRSKSMTTSTKDSNEEKEKSQDSVNKQILDNNKDASDVKSARPIPNSKQRRSVPHDMYVSSTESSTDSGMISSPEMVSPSIDTIIGENALADDQDGLSEAFSGRLTFSEIASSPIEPISQGFPFEAPYSCTSPPISSNITFEVISAEVIKDGRSGHVTYTILINPHRDSTKISPTVVKRRYSDFEHLHQALKKKFPSILSNISFPRKLLTGNFTCETIAKRSTAFEQYLTHLYSFFDVRYSKHFMEFFTHDDMQVAVDFFLEGKYSNSVPLLERVIPVLQKLYGNFHILVCQCMCCLLVCFLELEKTTVAQSCAEVALECCLPVGSAADQELKIALLSTAIRLYWQLGVDKRNLETQLESFYQDDDKSSSSVNVNKNVCLKEVLVKVFSMPVPR